MATTVRRRSGVAIVRVPSNGGRLKRGARRVGTAGARIARDQKHTFAAAAAAGILGYVARPGGPELPHIQALGVAGTYGLIAWGLSMARIGGEMVRHAATGLLCAAVYDYARQQPAATSGYEDDVD